MAAASSAATSTPAAAVNPAATAGATRASVTGIGTTPVTAKAYTDAGVLPPTTDTWGAALSAEHSRWYWYHRTEVPSRTVWFMPVEVAESVKARVVEARAEVAVAAAAQAPSALAGQFDRTTYEVRLLATTRQLLAVY